MKIRKIYENSENNLLTEFLDTKEEMYKLIEEFYMLRYEQDVEILNVVLTMRVDMPLSLYMTDMESDNTYDDDMKDDEYLELVKFIENPEYLRDVKKYNL
jgi:hypothetical protein